MLALWLAVGLLSTGGTPTETRLSGRLVRSRGKVGTLDAKWREELRQAEEEHQAAIAALQARVAAEEAKAEAETRKAIRARVEEAKRLDARIAATIAELKARIDAEVAAIAAIEAERAAAEQRAREIDEDDAITALLAF